MPDMAGKLYGIGVGPGDPELMTIKAVETLKITGHVFAPIARSNNASIAYDIAKKYIPTDTPLTYLLFPMLKDKTLLSSQWMENYHTIEQVIRQGIDCAFITLGDPGTYSTFTVMQRHFAQHAPDIEVETIPGITSFAFAAAQAGTPLVEGNEILSIVSGNDSAERVAETIDCADTVVFLKTYRNRDRLLKIIEEKGFIRNCLYVQKCGLDGEGMVHDVEKLAGSPEYLSLIVMKKNRQGLHE
jgi:precorrin-2/cobalt-factor-2 C20-methyltransferase